MLNSFCKILVKNNKATRFRLKIPAYTFILGRIFSKRAEPEKIDPKQTEQEEKMQTVELEAEKKRMKQEVENENQYDLMQRQKDIELNRDFRSLQQKYKNTIPQDIGKSGFNELVFWSQNAQTPQQIAEMIKKFNTSPNPKTVDDAQTFLQFKQNVKATVYLADSYPAIVDYAHFGYKYNIDEPEFWLKIEEKCGRKPPRTDEEYSELIDILFVMANLGQGEVIFSSSEKILANRQFTVEQIAKLIIAFFRTERGQKEWVANLLVSLELQIKEINCDVIESILPILKQSKNVPSSFEQKVQNRIMQLEKELTHSVISVASNYFGFGKGQPEFWTMMERRARQHFFAAKNSKGKIPTSMLTEIITGIMSSYKFSPEYVTDLIIPQLLAKDCKVLYKLPPTVLSALSKNLYIYEMEEKTQIIEQMIQGIIMRNFEKVSEVKNDDLVQVLKDYTVTRLGSRQFYLFLEKIVTDKLADIKTQKYTIQILTAIYQESNLCSPETLQLLKHLAYE